MDAKLIYFKHIVLFNKALVTIAIIYTNVYIQAHVFITSTKIIFIA
jgi:hypothetical protein